MLLGQQEYGYWLTIHSVLSWFALFDLGLGNSLRNSLTEAVSKQDYKKAKEYISTAYVVVCVIFSIVLLCFGLASVWVNWSFFFKTPPFFESELSNTVIYLMTFLCVQFVGRLIVSIMLAVHQAALADFTSALGNVLVVVVLAITATQFLKVSLSQMAALYGGTLFVSLLVVTIYFFKKQPQLTPQISYYRSTHLRKIIQIGYQFFLIQIAGIVFYSTDIFIISQLFDAPQVVVYNISYRYFSVLSICWSAILTPFWSLIIDAHAKHAIVWIRTTVKSVLKFWVIFALISLLLPLGANEVYRFWLSKDNFAPISLSLCLWVYVIVGNFSAIFANALNGFGKVKIQMISAVGLALLNIPLSVVLARQMGLIGVPLATIICMLIGGIIQMAQYFHIINIEISNDKS